MNEERDKGAYYSGSSTPSVHEIAVFYSKNGELDEQLSTRIVVDLEKKTCSDGCWQHNGYPCQHAWTASTFERNGSVHPHTQRKNRTMSGRLLTIFCLRQAYNAHTNENMRAFVEHAVCEEFKSQHTLTTKFYESLSHVKYVPMADVALLEEA
jgi:hypothetical protein